MEFGNTKSSTDVTVSTKGEFKPDITLSSVAEEPGQLKARRWPDPPHRFADLGLDVAINELDILMPTLQ